VNEAAVPGGLRGRLGAGALLSDDRLARRAVKGDERAFAAIFDRYHQDLYRFCLAIVGNTADAQDALQNTMVKVLGALPGEERQIELKPWLYRIAHNESIELLRRRRPTEQLDPELATRGGSLAEDADSRDRLRRLIADLEQLPDRQRGALVMRELGGLDFEEIGAALGTSPGTARQTLYEARQSLRQMDEGREMNCDAVTRALSDADGRVTRRRDIRAHLRTCSDCRRFREEIEGRRRELGALAPLPAVAATGLLHGLLGGGASSGASTGAGAGLAGAAAGGAAKSLGAGAVIKGAAAVAAVAAVGVGAADRTGVVDATPWGGGSQTEQRSGADGTRETGDRAGGSQVGVGGAQDAATTKPAASGGGDASARTNAARNGSAGGAAGHGKTDGDRGPSGGHPAGRGRQKQHPETASHGQQTAGQKAGGKAAGQNGGAAKNGAAEQAKPAQPSKPPKPSAPPKPSPPVQTAPSEGAVTTPPKAPSGPGEATPPQPIPSPPDEAKAAPSPPEPPLGP
jgi:RNA polymerase sigma factor (sigma-70 family)